MRHGTSWITRFAGTWPFYLKLACNHIFARKLHGSQSHLSKTIRSELEQEIWDDAIPYLDTICVGFSSRQRDILSNLSTWQNFEDSWRFDPDVSRLLRDGILKISRAKLNFSCELFREYFSRKSVEETLAGHLIPSGEDAMTSISKTLSRLGTCVAEISGWDDSNESKIQEIAYVILRSQYHRVSREVHTSKGPKREYRCDIYVEDFDVIVEIKRIRNSKHSSSIQSEINDDIVGYRHMQPNQKIVILIWDKERHISDRNYFRHTYEREDPYLRIVFVP